ncbi:Putative AAA+ superfamily ATPase [Ignavibacterium album JCM 16511]|uniref:Putative AAA+ superfamily ATPase n=1 Tax=Ignavibacterium album (strain DSM 19864 / JCM 16511 / NBRC 101810 / Mat9-16) TaxID=945713 RepID=I0AIY8_IGNAJ|nr:DUF499 domain-containing protein [Ignavibacterium album]AFH48945.1 Putative AAA+ superfamily ATPase [Ignavibacterium album JCM 16511]
MKAFHTIAIPHKDILKGKLTLEVFAADLHEVSLNQGSDEYRNSKIFFEKTYLTNGLENLLSVVERRIKGNGGDPVIQLQTPFGGGKTHSLIALFHKAKEWKANKVVIVGEKIEATDTLWGLIEKQLTGKITKFKAMHAPGGESLKELLSSHQPLLILMDEVLQYITRAAGVKVEASNLAAQSIAFMQALTEAVSQLPNTVLLLSLPSSVPEHYDENAEMLYNKLQKVSGRVEKIYTPVEDSEITKIIRRRLFSDVDESEAEKIIKAYVEYLEKENLLPPNTQPSEYREQFLSSYPFIPDVIDVLYKRWGTFPQFQRTRGVLRLLAQVVSSLKDSNKPYITLADFDLSNQEIRQELLKHIGSPYNSVIASDITDKNSGATKVNSDIGQTYQGLSLGTRTATTIFMYSHSGGNVKGASVPEIKRSATTLDNISAVIDSVFDKLEKELFFLQKFNDKYFFSNMPNINKILVTYMDNIKESEIEKLEYELLGEKTKSHYLKVYLWEDKSNNINDDDSLKLVIIKKDNPELIKEIIKKKGANPRTKANTVIVLYPSDLDRGNFVYQLKRKIAYENILNAPNLNLSNEQRRDIKKELDKLDSAVFESLRKYYRLVAVPSKDDLKVIDLGVPTWGDIKSLSDEVYEKLINEKEILEKLSPNVLKLTFLKDNEFVFTESIYNSSLSAPGLFRLSSRNVLENAIVQGVREGTFGLGLLEGDKPMCKHYKENVTVYFEPNEIIIKDSVCIEQIEQEKQKITSTITVEETQPRQINPSVGSVPPDEDKQPTKYFEQLSLNLDLPKGKVSNLMGVLNYLQSKYEHLKIDITAFDGKMTKEELEDKIKEALRQSGIHFKFND